MRILGIDPGVATIGFGVVNAEGTRLRMDELRYHHHPGGSPAGDAPAADRDGYGAAPAGREARRG